MLQSDRGLTMFDRLAKPNQNRWHNFYAHGRAIFAEEGDDVFSALDVLDRTTQRHPYAGYFAYDLGRQFEPIVSSNAADRSIPLFAFVPSGGSPTAGLDPRGDPPSGRLIGSTFDRSAYETAVSRCLDYIAAGDVFQINLSQRLAVETCDTAEVIYDRLRTQFPAQYSAFCEFGHPQPGFAIVSNSPELFLKVERLPNGQRRIINRPIKGTRPNAPGMTAELLRSEKDQAELAMIVDLQRNDLGRICEIGSVKVTEPRTIETHPTVLHGVATVEGVLRENVSLTDILRATFPCGSITGCPKIRAMQIIDELEPVRRGVYCGAIGWIGGGEMELSVAIRTMTLYNGIAYVPVGGGIVADSTPAAEYEETLVKARAMLAALGVK